MIIKEKLDYGEKHFDLEYHDADSFDELTSEKVTQVYGLCFTDGKLVIGFGGSNQGWGLIGGTIEEGESYRQTLDREVQEESNMRVLEARPVGYQKLTAADGKTIYQLRYWCQVEPYGPFVADPAGSVTEIKLIDPYEYKQYFDWGKIGDRLVERAIDFEHDRDA